MTLAMEQPRQTLSVGYPLGDYVIGEVLFQDGFEITYLAVAPSVDDGALVREFFPFGSVMRAGDGSIRPVDTTGAQVLDQGLAAFRDQARMLAAVDHPSIERVLDLIEANGTAYLVTRREQGDHLGRVLAHGTVLNEQQILALLLPLLDGLEAVHRIGLAHADIRPQRILVRPDGSPVLTGFASARWRLTPVFGCPIVVEPGVYYPPELVCGQVTDGIGPPSDIYALAAVIYQALTGLIPPDAITRGGVVFGQPDPLQSIAEIARDKSSPHLLTALDRALVLDARYRPQDLEAWRAMIAGQNVPPPIPNRDKSWPGDGDKSVQPNGNAPRHTVRSAILVCAAAALSVAGFYLFPSLMEHSTFDVTRPPPSNPADAAADSIAASKAPQDGRQEAARMPPTKEALTPVAPASFPTAPEVSPSATERVPQSPQEPNRTPVASAVSGADQGSVQNATAVLPTTLLPDPHAPEIARLLAAAEDDVSALRLTKPTGNNAFDRYLEVFKLDPGNARAVQGVTDIVQRYEKLAGDAARGGNKKKALLSIDRALAVLESDHLHSLLPSTLRRIFETDIERLQAARTGLHGQSKSSR